jgi:hypothetical protein
MATIYRKTAKGQTEIETRAHRLPPRLRSALILIDGKRRDEDMHKLIAQQPEEALRTLSEQGFIEVIGITATTAAPVRAASVPAPVAAPVPAAAPAPAPARSFESLRGECVRAFTDAVGPIAEALALKMERTRSAADLRPLVEVAQNIIANARGNKAAADFGTRFLGALGG